MKIWSVWKDRQTIDQHNSVKGSYHWHSCVIYGGEGLLKELLHYQWRIKELQNWRTQTIAVLHFVSDAPSLIRYVFVVRIENEIRIVYIAC